MSSLMPMPHLTVEEYLEGEKTSPVRHEYVAGHLFARDGISARHNGISLNLATRLRSHLRGSQCRVFMSAVKARIEALDFFYYPDVMVCCNSEDRDEYFSNRPCLIVEVMSPSTEAIDRREKLHAYQTLDSLREYVLLAQDEVKAHIYRRDDDGKWWVQTLTEADELRMESVDLNIPLLDLYEEI